MCTEDGGKTTTTTAYYRRYLAAFRNRSRGRYCAVTPVQSRFEINFTALRVRQTVRNTDHAWCRGGL